MGLGDWGGSAGRWDVRILGVVRALLRVRTARSVLDMVGWDRYR